MVVRLAGEELFDKAAAGEASFTDAPFVTAAQKLADLGQMKPFQPGFEAATYNDALGLFRRWQGRHAPDGRLGLCQT